MDPTTEEAGTAGEPFVSLYRRFRPGRFDELRGQPHVVRALRSAVQHDMVAHAYLLSGPRGTGKTTTARILARALNCADPRDGEPCGVCPSCVEIGRGTSLDVHELDAASNNGVDAIRELVGHAALATPGRWKVYIVDEVHMLSNAAANALLKTLEEPPSHVVFVLATTDPQKVLPTIKSRTQHFELRLLGADTMEELLEDVRRRGGLEIDDEAIAVAIRRGRGSARDALTALDQMVASGSVEDARPGLAELTGHLCSGDSAAVLVAVADLHEGGWTAQQLASEIVEEARQGFLLTLAPQLADVSGSERERLSDMAGQVGLARLVRIMEVVGSCQVDMRESPDPRVVLEVALVRVTHPDLDDSPAALIDRIARLERSGRSSGGAVGGLPDSERPSAAQPSPAQAGAPQPSPAQARSRPRPPEPTPPPSRPTDLATDPAPAGSAPRDPALPDPAPPGVEAAGAGPAPLGTSSVDQGGTTAQAGEVAAQPPGGGQGTAGTEEVEGPVSTPRAGPAGAVPGRDELVEAWGDHVLRSLPARTRAVFMAGRFVDVDGEVAVYALPNPWHRDRCEEVREVAEGALTSYFGTHIRLRLIDEGEAAPPGSAAATAGRPAPSSPPRRARRSGTAEPFGGAENLSEPAGDDPGQDVGGRPGGNAPSGRRPASPPEPGAAAGPAVGPGDRDEDEDEALFDPGETTSEVEMESVAQFRLLEAFPGAEEVEK